MPKFLLATKIDMTRTFREDGTVVPVSRLSCAPSVVTQLKTKDKDGYQAVQVGFGKLKHVGKARAGHLKASGKQPRTLKEFHTTDAFEVGQAIDVSQFKPGDMVQVTGWSKGRGFQGVVKRHHFHGHPSSHGHKDQLRMPGSIGAGGVQHVRKGMRMAGHMGTDKVTVHGLEVMAVDAEKHELVVKGAVPGARGGLLIIQAK